MSWLIHHARGCQVQVCVIGASSLGAAQPALQETDASQDRNAIDCIALPRLHLPWCLRPQCLRMPTECSRMERQPLTMRTSMQTTEVTYVHTSQFPLCQSGMACGSNLAYVRAYTKHINGAGQPHCAHILLLLRIVLAQPCMHGCVRASAAQT